MPDDFDDSSDYGSDFTPDEEELLNDLLAKVATEHATAQASATATATATATTTTTSKTVQVAVTAVADIEDYAESPASQRVPKVLGREKPGFLWQNRTTWQVSTSAGARADQISGNVCAASVEHPDSIEGRERQRERDVARERELIGDSRTSPVPDLRSPIERFRKPPNKAFSVTDLISPAWCELQYWYTLTKHGRKRRTPAMKQGSTIHKTLEDEVHTTVPVEITTKEDALALRLWNVIQGLRTLREYGLTRELEVWGLADGELVNGVIDQLSYECPDPELEATAAKYYADVEASRAVMPEYQMSLTDYLLAPAQGGKRLSEMMWKDEPDEPVEDAPSTQSSEAFNIPRVYLTDIKTRASGSIPTIKSTSFRPTLLQLQIYYHMLNRLTTTDEVSIETLASRYDLDPNRTFTDAFIAEVGGLNDQFFDALSASEFDPDFIPSPEDAARRPSIRSSGSLPSASQDSTSILLEHNNLSSLWKFMKDQLRLTFLPSLQPSVSVAPSIPSEFQPSMLEPYPTIISPLLTARYLSSAPTADLHTSVLGSRSFLFDPTTMSSYLSDQMDWWRGNRDPRGVEIMEAWKCRICEFREECSWRQEREWSMARRKKGPKGLDAAV
ncbi:exonuclease V [Aspergillus lentulus]|uniref:Exonuclease V n=1 Tax=Aspergillus lentulus TaxID=293939 RepID=A0AAN4TE79_ASPLE|nr:exonuclease V [Aspergillus lentulus]